MSEISVPERVKTERGVVYSATEMEFVRERVRSTETTREAMPDSSICLITDEATKVFSD
jgi:hypothetical protein